MRRYQRFHYTFDHCLSAAPCTCDVCTDESRPVDTLGLFLVDTFLIGQWIICEVTIKSVVHCVTPKH